MTHRIHAGHRPNPFFERDRFLRDFVVEHSGERKGQLDIKHGGLIPIVDLARRAAMAAGVASASTAERLRAAEAAGTLDSSHARTLAEAFGFIFALRLDHQVEQLRRGEAPDDFIDPTALNPLARSYLRSAFRAIASVQSGLATELSLGIRWGLADVAARMPASSARSDVAASGLQRGGSIDAVQVRS